MTSFSARKPSPTGNTCKAELDKATQHGFVTSTGQHIPLATGCAAPFRLDSGIVGAISVTRSRYETTDADLLRFGPLVVTAAKEVVAQRARTTPPGPVLPLRLRLAV